jgi:uncharacterized membrane protein
MAEWLAFATEYAVLAIDTMALLVIIAGTVQAFVNGIVVGFFLSRTDHSLRLVWLRYGRWLIAGLTFQLAADIIETSVAPTWEDLGRLAAIAAIRTLLNFFLERDLESLRERNGEGEGAATAK